MRFPIYLTRKPIFHVQGLVFHGIRLSQNTTKKTDILQEWPIMWDFQMGAVSHGDVCSQRDYCPSSSTGYRTPAFQSFSATWIFLNVFFLSRCHLFFSLVPCSCHLPPFMLETLLEPLSHILNTVHKLPIFLPTVRTHSWITTLAAAKHTKTKLTPIIPKSLNIHF